MMDVVDLITLLRARSGESTSDAYTYVEGDDARRLSYADLDRSARAIAASLQQRGAAGQRVLILYPPGLDYVAAFFGCLYAGAVAVPAYPPDPTRLARTLPRLTAIVRDAQAKFALTTSQLLAFGPMMFGQAPELAALTWLTTDDLASSGSADGWTRPAVDGSTLAFLQYTSGSTGDPKGVMLTHGNLLANERMISHGFGTTSADIVAGWLPLYHDMGLIGTLLQPLYLGVPCVLMSPLAFLSKPLRWLQAISKYRATASGAPNFAYDLCVRKVTDEDRAKLDLDSWRIAFTGAEPVRAETLERFARAFAPCGFRKQAFYPCYGLAEATLLVTGGTREGAAVLRDIAPSALEQHRVAPPTEGDCRRLVGSGRAILDEEVLIVDPTARVRLSGDAVGEIWVAGPHVAQGYWNRPQLTAETFGARLASGEGPYLRTGDLGFLDHGELYVTGRAKDLIIIRGRNHYPQDIELTVERAEQAVRPGCSAAFSVEVDGAERLVVVCELDARQASNVDSIIDRLRQVVSEQHEVQVHAIVLVKSGAVPKTSSGKIQRHACRKAFVDETLEAIRVWRSREEEPLAAPADLAAPTPPPAAVSSVPQPLETEIATLVARRLGLTRGALDVTDPLTKFGIDSLAAVELVDEIERAFGVAVPMETVLAGPSVRDLARHVGERRPTERTATKADQNEYPLSLGQKTLWLLHELAPESAAYNVATAVRVHNALDVPALRRSFQRLVLRHPALRTTFLSRDGSPVTKVAAYKEVDFDLVDGTGWSEGVLRTRVTEAANRPFDLAKGPLFRVRVFQHAAGPVMLIAVHHIVVDMWSLVIIGDELGRLYREETGGDDAGLTDLRGHYGDHVRNEARLLSGGDGDKRASYWKQRLRGELPVLELPLDRPRPAAQTYRGAIARFTLPAALGEQLTRIGKQHGATLYMTLLAAYYVLLQRHTGQTDIVVGSPTRGRSRPELRDVVGYFVNMMPLRADVSPNQTFDELLVQVRKLTLTSFASSDYPFFAMVETISPNRDPRYSPIFQTTFTFQKAQGAAATGMTALALGNPGTITQVGALSLDVVPLDQGIAQFDLALAMGETDAGLAATFEYNTDLFDASTIERMIERFRILLESIAADSAGKIGELPLLTAEERQLLSVQWNDTKHDYPTGTRVEHLISACAARTPDAVALEHRGATLTYRELDIRANQLAHRLRTLGVGTAGIVAVHLDRSLDMLVAWIAAWKAGAAYLPIATDLGAERIAYMLDDAGAQIVVTSTALAAPLAVATPVLRLDAESNTLAQEPISPPEVGVLDAAAPAYVIYTSGSTGKPKGSLVSHRSLCNLVGFATRRFGLGSGVRHAQVAGISFDASVLETWPTLASGGTLCLMDDELKLDARAMRDWLVDTRIAVAFVPVALLIQMYEMQWPTASPRTIWTGGDAVTKRPPAGLPFGIVNVYGPTECTVTCLVSDDLALAGTTHRAPEIGRVVDNTQVYILEPHGSPSPIGVRGELVIAGDCVGLGYLRRPELTAEKFVANPFGSGSMYRTGDMARWLPTGVVEFLGRTDSQVKIRGHRIELGEIEATLARHPDVSDVVVLARDHLDDKRLVAYVVGRARTPDAAQLRTYLKDKLPSYMVPSAFVALDQLPLTSNGKVDRKALPDPSWAGGPERDYVPPRTPNEEMLAAIWGQVLHVQRVGVEDNFFEIGGHSLLATQVVSRMRQVLGVELPLRSLFESPTIAALASAIDVLRVAPAAKIAPIPRFGDLELSFAQQRLWFLDQLEPNSPLYNISGAARLVGALDVERITRGLNAVVARHESLRTTFVVRDGKPLQSIAPTLRLDVPIIEVSSADDARTLAVEEAQRPFDLAVGPLMRACVLRLAAEEHWLLISMHHIVSDGWSLGLLMNEVATLYAGGELPPLAIQYADFASWQRTWLAGDVLTEQVAYWKTKLANLPAVHDLPTDRQRPATMSHRGATRAFRLPSELAAQLDAIGRQESATLFMTLLAAFQTLLHRYSRQDDIVIGSPVAGRNRAETEPLIGFFVNTLVLRGDLSGNPTFRELLARVRDVALGAYAHQDVPFERLVEEVHPQRTTSHTPLFQVMFVLQNTPAAARLPGSEQSLVQPDTGTAKFDLTLSIEATATGLDGLFEYSTDLFDSATIDRMVGHFETLLHAIVEAPGRRIDELALLTAGERKHLLVDCNDTARVYEQTWVHERFEAQASRTPAAIAVECDGTRMRYDELERRANQLARRLAELGVGPEFLVGVAMQRSVEMVVALLAILKAGGAYVPLDPAYPSDRLLYMIETARPAVVLTQAALISGLPQTSTPLLAIDQISDELDAYSSAPLRVRVVPANLAYVIFTSGSTGRPKGAAIDHKGLANYLSWALDAYGASSDAGAPVHSSLSFDLTVTSLYVPLLSGATVRMIPSDDLDALAASLAESGGHGVIKITPAHLDLLGRQVADDVAARSTRGFVIGGEALRGETLAMWRAKSPTVRLWNEYGPTETVVGCCVWELPQGEASPSVPPIGWAIANTELHVLDLDLQLVPVGVPGELYIGGHGVARGYLNRPELTAERFVPDPFGPPGSRMYRTGDLVKRRANGILEYLGRLDHQVKIRGFRIELGEIEAVLTQHPDITETVVVAREDIPGQKRLVAYVASARDLSSSDLKVHLKTSLPDYMVPAAFVVLPSLPLTPNGKVDRKALPAPTVGANSDHEPVAPRTATEELLVSIWMEVLKIERVGVEDDFFEIGGHSLLATQVASRIREAFGIELPLRRLFEHPTVVSLGHAIEQARRASEPPIAPAPRDREISLSYAQQRLWFLDQLEPDSVAYNVCGGLRLVGSLDVAALARSFDAIIGRHDALRTTFANSDGRPVQVIAPSMSLDVSIVDVGTTEEAWVRAREEMNRPFDLSRGPLVRAKVLRLGANEHWLLLSMHHIVSDGWSLGVLFQELAALYRGETLAPLAIQYADFSVWQRAWLTGDVLELQLAYWRKQLAGIPALLELPTDRPRPRTMSHRGGRVSFEISSSLTRSLEALARKQSVTQYMLLLAAFQTLLHRYSRQDDIVVGSPVANRNREAIEGLIGFFVNTLVLRTDFSGNPTFRELVAHVRETTLGAYSHQDVPFEKLVEELKPARSLGHSPLFQVMFGLDKNGPSIALPGVEHSALDLDGAGGTAQFDLTLSMQEHPDGLRGFFQYSTDLFDEETIARLASHFEEMLTSIVQDPDQRVGRLELLTRPEWQQIVVDWNAVDRPFPRILLHGWVSQRASENPDALAVFFEGKTLSYGELDRAANALAHELRALGVQAETRVGICVERSLEMVIAMLGALKAGGCYVPLDPAYPPERLRYMLADSSATIILSQQHLLPRLEELGTRVTTMDVSRFVGGPGREEPPLEISSPNHLAYVIYTSGSTGTPKGAMISHGAVSAFLAWQGPYFKIGAADRMLFFRSPSFDVSIWELFGALAAGGSVIIAKEQEPHYLAELMEQQQITLASFNPTLLEAMLLEESFRRCSSLRSVACGGEPLTFALQERYFEVHRGRELCNTYGTTETTVASMCCRLVPGRNVVQGGAVCDNEYVYILNQDLQPVPVGVAGEAYIGGIGVSRGFLSRPGLTAEKFLPDPFSSKPGARMYRTGDLARWLPDGNLDFLGRIDNQVKVRGYRIELGEIEAVLAQHPLVRDCAVLAREDTPGNKRLVGYVLVGRERPEQAELRTHLQGRLPDYMVPSVFVVLDAFPQTPNGKTDRKALPAPDMGATVEFIPPSTPTEVAIAGMFSEVLGTPDIGLEHNFFTLGGHSLLATQVISRVRADLGIDLPVRVLFEEPTVAGLAQRVDALLATTGATTEPPIVPVPHDRPLVLSFAQERLWFLDQLEPGTHYNLPCLIEMHGPLNVSALERSVRALVTRHDALRTTFETRDGRPVQVIAPSLDLSIPRVDLSHLPATERAAEAQRIAGAHALVTFDLARGPLLRAEIVILDEDHHWLVLVFHHIVFDGWSMGVFQRELAALYSDLAEGRAPSLASPPFQYADFAVWQRSWLAGRVLDEKLDYLRQTLRGAPALLELPTDRPRPAVLSGKGAVEPFTVPASVVSALQSLARDNSATLYMTLLSAFQTLLSRYSRQDDIVVGSPVANRNREATEGVIGFFVNTLVLRGDLSGDPTFIQLLARIKDTALAAYAHQDVPFEKIVEALNPERTRAYTPLFQVMFVLQNAPTGGSLPGMRQQVHELETHSAKFDLTLALEERDGGLNGAFEFATDLFDRDTIVRMSGHFVRLLEAIVADANVRISRLPILSSEERHHLVVELNATQAEFPRDALVHELFEAQVKLAPDRPALVGPDGEVTYKELDLRANAFAHVLRARGVGPDVIVGILLPRTVETVVSMLAILKAGGAYLPLDPAYPNDRLELMAADTRCALLITQRALVPSWMPADRVFVIDEYASDGSVDGAMPPPRTAVPRSLAYIIFTSGSTGRPKGVMLAHAGLVNLVTAQNSAYRLGPGTRVFQFAAFSFDVSVWETFTALANGAALCIAPQGAVLAGDTLTEVYAARKANAILLPPSALAVLDPTAVEGTIFSGGEACTAELVQRWVPGRRFVNAYGPTEATVIATTHDCIADDRPPPLGRPVPNTRVYVLDQNLEPTPIGVPGELHIAGIALARGYFGRPSLTAERFVPDVFAKEPGGRLYKTGDLGRIRADGLIEYLGRIDHQVKLRGFRIELGEIETSLMRQPGVDDAVVLVREESPGDKRLVAFVVGHDTSASELRAALRVTLPDYMVPAAFVLLDKMPMTPANKVDRRALQHLKVDAITSSREYVAPRTHTELAVAQIYSELLRVPTVSAHDSFFELGGHSLLAMQLVSAIHARIGATLPISALFQAHTVEALANAIDDGSGQAHDKLVTLRRGGTQPPLVLIHPVGGSVFCYQALVSRLAIDSPCYGFEARGLSRDEVPTETIEEMAEEYVTTMISRLGAGPFHIAGWSFGGIVALEVVRRLRARGHRVLSTIMIDSHAPSTVTATSDDQATILSAFAGDLGVEVSADELRQLGDDALRRVVELAHVAEALPAHVGRDHLARRLDVFMANVRAVGRYNPGRIEGRVTLIRAEDTVVDPAIGWRDHIPQDLDVHVIHGNHYSIVEPPGVDVLARLVDDALSDR